MPLIRPDAGHRLLSSLKAFRYRRAHTAIEFRGQTEVPYQCYQHIRDTQAEKSFFAGIGACQANEAKDIDAGFKLYSSIPQNSRLLVRVDGGNADLEAKTKLPEIYFHPEFAYLLVIDANTIDLSLVLWMIECGARELTILGNFVETSEERQSCIDNCSSLECNVAIIDGTAYFNVCAQRAVKAAKSPAWGVIYDARNVLAKAHSEANGESENLLRSSIDDLAARKFSSMHAYGVQNLYHSLDNYPLDFFTVLAALPLATEEPYHAEGQARLNSLMEIVRYRRSLGMPASLLGAAEYGRRSTHSSDASSKSEPSTAPGRISVRDELEFFDFLQFAIRISSSSHKGSKMLLLRKDYRLPTVYA
ncbi:hypothetical protein EV356DRAFT_542533 [Viridothelium virens]|uniref:Ketoreductase (KR) domain-containing protein n=1 Tax=Viridothelium virens TaxID=1048519 RepID=A0A6A6GRT6_VIRVR|nr:hypothetical protein EV356DRAFT_542533 [Viridothelium virens]